MTNDERLDKIISIMSEIRDLLKPRASSGGTEPARAFNGSNISYAKLKSGDWGIRSPVAVTAGQKVQVHTKTGKVKTETVQAIVHQGRDRDTGGQYFLASIVPRGKGQEESAPATAEAEAPSQAEEFDVPF